MSTARLLRRLSGRPDDLLDDLRRLLSIRLGETPIRPELGLPVQPPWLPDADTRRRLQEAIAGSLRHGEPRLDDIAVRDGDDVESPVFMVTARCRDGSRVGAQMRPSSIGGMEVE